MNKIALVYMSDSNDNFFIENPPDGKPEKWISKFVFNESDVEHVVVHELGKIVSNWSNPNGSPEEDF